MAGGAIQRQPLPAAERRRGRDSGWEHLNNADVLLVPDKWEYPWYAAWDFAFHCVALAQRRPGAGQGAAHPAPAASGTCTRTASCPRSSGTSDDANPPVHAWAAWRVFEIDRERRDGRGDRAFLERVFHKLLINFTWWVNRKDVDGRNVFQGGFLGLDNIGVFDRSEMRCRWRLPRSGRRDELDGDVRARSCCAIALELAREDPIYQDVATKFFEHFLYIAGAMNDVGGRASRCGIPRTSSSTTCSRRPDGRAVPLKIRSLVGLIPLFAVEVLESEQLAGVPEFAERLRWFLRYRPDLALARLALARARRRGHASPRAPPRPPGEARPATDAR